MPIKTTLTALFASLALHGAVVGYSLHVLPWTEAPRRAADPIEISYVTTKKTVPKPSEIPLPKKKVKGIRPPASRIEAAAMTEVNPQPAKPALSSLPAKKDAAKTSVELLADPEKGRIFSDYFSVVKEAIHAMLRKKCEGKKIGQGSVTLGFVLNSEGKLERVTVLETDAKMDPLLRNIAVECLREAAPFANFPKDLNSARVSFSLTVFFDGL